MAHQSQTASTKERDVFERFTQEARQVVILAQQEAREMKCRYIGTEHILIGLLLEGNGLGAQALMNSDATLEKVREKTLQILPAGDAEPNGHSLPLTPRAKKVLELGLREMLSMGRNYVGTEHVLLGLIREHEGVGIQVLVELDIDPFDVREKLLESLSRPDPGAPPIPPEAD